jgi:hypothetical protein
VTTASTAACSASARRSGVGPPPAAAASVDRTTRESIVASEEATASARLNPRKSVSGSGLSRRNGSTINRVTTGRDAGRSTVVAVMSPAARSAAAKAAASS